MSRYFTVESSPSKQHLDDTTLAMIFYRALMQLKPEDLPSYGRLQNNSVFIEQLVELYKELKNAQLSVHDLTGLDHPQKQEDLIKIIELAETIMIQQDYNQDSPLQSFARAIKLGLLNNQLSKTVVVIDGFSRFSAEEDYLLSLLNNNCQEVIIGSYVSQKLIKNLLLREISMRLAFIFCKIWLKNTISSRYLRPLIKCLNQPFHG